MNNEQEQKLTETTNLRGNFVILLLVSGED